MMQRLSLPFTLGQDQDTKAVSEIAFTVQSPRSSFRSVSIAGLRFMKVYEHERYNLTNYPFNETWDEHMNYLQLQRENIAIGNLVRNDLAMGHTRAFELKSLDMLPHRIEFSMDNARPIDRSSIVVGDQLEYQSTDSKKAKFSESDRTIQSLLILNTSLAHEPHKEWEGVVSCDMNNLGAFSLVTGGHGTNFILRVSMYSFLNKALSVLPEMQVDLLFR